MAGAKVKVPERARKGEVIEIRSLAIHPMESGFRHDNVGKLVPRHIIKRFTCHYDGKEVFSVTLHPAITANPYFSFHVVATTSGEFVFTWTDDRGQVITERAGIEVAAS
ncbi:MAG: thiosulfate oxidation carrier complex protein SoxZ [Burkholderiales bacterium]|jgi:sulfur-oxidizing protein SoxZ